MKRHPKRLAEAGISEARYQELKQVCRQYRELKRGMDRLRAGIRDRTGRGSAWRLPDPTANAAVRLADHPWARRVKLIEDCAGKVAEPVMAQAILRSVADGMDYDAIRPPCGRAQFYVLRQLFFIELDGRLWDDQAR